MLFILEKRLSFLLQNCRELGLLSIRFCSKITGIGFLECPKTLTKLKAIGCKFKASGCGLDERILAAIVRKAGEGCIDTEAVVTISKGCPLLKKLILTRCDNIELEGWEAIGRKCKNLEILSVQG
ncbi:hypothetical protein MKW98_030131 [Papaver atlanticum]|uniref:Uncharacterized protein n=1 Tax=Papaver atlanticum TaxID=357466 RepID=A0AAD4T7L8_9MAGN|nr:hypothetical protein MKW98_030131 [Papaver atlanticum]